MEEARVGFDRLLATVTFGRSQNKSLNLWSGEIRLAQEQGSRKQKGTSIFSWAKHIWRISFPFFLNITKKTRNIFFFFQYSILEGIVFRKLVALGCGHHGRKSLVNMGKCSNESPVSVSSLQVYFISFFPGFSWGMRFFPCLCTVTSSVLSSTLPTQQHFPSYVLCFDLWSPSPPPNALLLHQKGGAQPLEGKKKQLFKEIGCTLSPKPGYVCLGMKEKQMKGWWGFLWSWERQLLGLRFQGRAIS